MTALNLRILCVDDDEDSSELIYLMLQQSNADYEITSVQSVAEALWLMRTKEYDLYVLDYRYPGTTGLELCRTIRLRDVRTPIMFFTGEARESVRQEALANGANAYLVKPTDLNKLTNTAKQLIGIDGMAMSYAAQSSSERVESKSRTVDRGSV